MTSPNIITKLKRENPKAAAIAERLWKLAKEYRQSENDNVLRAKSIGDELHALKDDPDTDHGDFLEAGEKLVGYSPRRRQQFMELSRDWDKIRSDAVQKDNRDDDGKPIYPETLDGQLALWRHYKNRLAGTAAKASSRPKVKATAAAAQERVEALEAENKDLKAKLANAKSASHLEPAPQRPELRNPDKRLSERDRELLSKVFLQMLDAGTPTAEVATRTLLRICERSGIHPTELQLFSGGGTDVHSSIINTQRELIRILSVKVRALEEELARYKVNSPKAEAA
jgi:murein DD-endopeptidase MepM/ murein hydrolase activator NlpD